MLNAAINIKHCTLVSTRLVIEIIIYWQVLLRPISVASYRM